MVFIYYEGKFMSIPKLEMPEKTILSKNLQEICKNERNIAEIIPYSPEMKAPDCVYQTIMRRMDELNKEITEYEDILRKLKGEYKAHANFMLGSPFGRDLSHSSDNKD